MVQELYHELHALDRFQIDLKRKQQEEEFYSVNASRGSIPGQYLFYLLSSSYSYENQHL